MSAHDGPAANGRHAAVRDREDAVVARLRALGTAVDGEPDPGFRAATRQRLVAMAAVRTPRPAEDSRPLWRRVLSVRADAAPATRRRERLTAGLAATALAVTAVATLVAVSSGARPGNALYALKRGTEQTQLALAGTSRGETLLDFATTRLSELRSLDGSADAAVVVSTLHTMDEQTTDGAAWLAARAVQIRSVAPVHVLTVWTGDQQAGLSALAPNVPPGARGAAGSSASLLDRIGARAYALTVALSCAAGTAVRGSDALGPIPVTCGTRGATTPAATGGADAGGTANVPPVAPAGQDGGTGTTGTGGTGTTATGTTGTGSTTTGTSGTGTTSTGTTGTGSSGTGTVGGALGTPTGPTGGGTGSVLPTSPPTSIISIPPLLPGAPTAGRVASNGPAGRTTGWAAPTDGVGGGFGVCRPCGSGAAGPLLSSGRVPPR